MPDPARRIASTVESWFSRHQRPLPWRATYDPYRVWVSEVMLQQTRMDTVLRYFSSFVQRFPSVLALASATEEAVLTAWSGLGYYRRARMLHRGAADVAQRFSGRIPTDTAALRSIAGIGRYTAGAIASIAYRQHEAIVDGNIARVLARLFGIEMPVGSSGLMAAAWREAGRLVAASSDPRLFNQGVMELGALVCTPRKPSCPDCPLRALCLAYATSRADSLPLAREKRTARRIVVPLYLVGDGTGRLLMRRESGALMTAMFHLPHGSTELLGGRLLPVIERELVGTFRHTITNRSVEFQLHRAELRDGVADSGEFAWVHPDELAGIPHPSYVAKAVRMGAGTH